MKILKYVFGHKFEFEFKILDKISNYGITRKEIAIYNFMIDGKYEEDTYGYLSNINEGDFSLMEITIKNKSDLSEIDMKVNEYRDELLDLIAINDEVIKEKSKELGNLDFANNIEIEIIDDEDFGVSLIGIDMFNPVYMDLANKIDLNKNNPAVKNILGHKVLFKDIITITKDLKEA